MAKEINHLLAAIIIIFIVISLGPVINSDCAQLLPNFIFSAIIILTAVYSKKLIASYLDSSVEHKIWVFRRYGFKEHWKFEKAIPGGIILPLFLSVFSLGKLKFIATLSYETKALKRRAAKRHGFYSFTEMTDLHNAFVGAAGIVGVLLLSLIAYFIPLQGIEILSKVAAFYAFSNMIPLPKLDGLQILVGSRVLWTALALITLIFTGYAFLLV